MDEQSTPHDDAAPVRSPQPANAGAEDASTPATAKASTFIGPAAEDSLHVMSYNLRSPADPPPHSWDERVVEIAALLHREQPSLLGTQEGNFRQVRDVASALPRRYDWIGLGRSGGSSGEYAAIFYDADRLQPLAYNHLWLSDTPYLIASTTWGNQVTRMLTWIRFTDQRTGHEFVHLNTHFDHVSALARLGAAMLVNETIAEFDVPAVITGDFNARPDSNIHQELVGEEGLRDTWLAAARQVTPEYSSFTGWHEPVIGTKRIDWILVSPQVRTDVAAINPCTGAATHPSDHLPVQASVWLPEPD